MPQESPFPPIPDAPAQEGARWRHHKPTSEQVAEWFKTVPMDEGMEHGHYVGGVVIIPQSEKVKYATERGTIERHEMVFTPYIQIATRVAYFRRLAESRGLIPRIGAAQVPRNAQVNSPYFNANMPEGFWFHVIPSELAPARFLCCTMVAQMFEPQSYGSRVAGSEPMPVLEGVGVKQGSAGSDANGIMKVMTGAIGRALAAAGILVAGTGFASADDMQEYTSQPEAGPAAAQLPDTDIPAGVVEVPTDPAEALTALRRRAVALHARMQGTTASAEWSPWWQERSTNEGWGGLNDIPADQLTGVVAKLERLVQAAKPLTGVEA
jgi:hypothetical protein